MADLRRVFADGKLCVFTVTPTGITPGVGITLYDSQSTVVRGSEVKLPI